MEGRIVRSNTRANALDPILCPHIVGFMHLPSSPSSRLAGFLAILVALGCASSPAPRSDAAADDASSPDQLADLLPPISGVVEISAAAASRTPRATSGIGVSYWQWSPTWGNLIAGTETQVAALKPMVIRIGGYNNDANTPDNFDNAQMDKAVAYARAIGAEPIVQVPLLAADSKGTAPTPENAAAMVTYANVTAKYGIKYFSIGNEPDLYPDATGSTKGIAGYTASAFCTSLSMYTAAMKAVDPTIKILGPELSWKYQSGTNDWLTTILQTCGSNIDVVTVHRYPIDPAKTTVAAAAADAANLNDTIVHLRSIMQQAGVGDKPLAITEANITWDGDPAKSTMPASSGTVPAGLWAADTFGMGIQNELWTMLYWSTREGWTLGLFPSSGMTPRPSYWALDLYANHFGPTLLSVTSTPDGVRVYASRNQADDATQLVVVNWNQASAILTFQMDGLAAALAATTFTLPAVSFAAVEIPDVGAASAVSYSETQRLAGQAPQPLASP
jgi:Glycosyl hydrolase catalytic core